jgi:hypothetical protein
MLASSTPGRVVGFVALAAFGAGMIVYCRPLGIALARRLSGGGNAMLVVLAAGLFFVVAAVVALVQALD